jgi:hypothetical protein
MGIANRREILGRVAALFLGPVLLGRQALDRTLRDLRATAPEKPPAPPLPAVLPPSRSIKRRG